MGGAQRDFPFCGLPSCREGREKAHLGAGATKNLAFPRGRLCRGEGRLLSAGIESQKSKTAKN